MNFKDKVCVITGGANGIGLCLVNEFSSRGAKVAFVDMDSKAGMQTCAMIRSNGGEALFYNGDISEEAVLEGFVDEVIKTYGKIEDTHLYAYLTRGSESEGG